LRKEGKPDLRGAAAAFCGGGVHPETAPGPSWPRRRFGQPFGERKVLREENPSEELEKNLIFINKGGGGNQEVGERIGIEIAQELGGSKGRKEEEKRYLKKKFL